MDQKFWAFALLLLLNFAKNIPIAQLGVLLGLNFGERGGGEDRADSKVREELPAAKVPKVLQVHHPKDEVSWPSLEGTMLKILYHSVVLEKCLVSSEPHCTYLVDGTLLQGVWAKGDVIGSDCHVFYPGSRHPTKGTVRGYVSFAHFLVVRVSS